ncbi:uncharacterized protein LOC141856134 [Brevipalpus obovatus]|uniref:uncharacterized protein LOC141856134 n=1 Tax=Brevipalpus obovatus TaxID=246614 RepID=UPI003D9E2F06
MGNPLPLGSQFPNSLTLLIVLGICLSCLTFTVYALESTDQPINTTTTTTTEQHHSPVIFKTVKSANKNGTVDYGYYIETRPKTSSWLRPLVFGVTILGSERQKSDQPEVNKKCRSFRGCPKRSIRKMLKNLRQEIRAMKRNLRARRRWSFDGFFHPSD